MGGTQVPCAPPRSGLAVNVIHKDTRRPIAGALINLGGTSSPRPKPTRANGAALFEPLPAGPYTVDVTLPRALATAHHPVARVPATVNAGRMTFQTIRAEPLASLRVSVQARGGGTPRRFPGVRVRVRRQGGGYDDTRQTVPGGVAAFVSLGVGPTTSRWPTWATWPDSTTPRPPATW